MELTIIRLRKIFMIGGEKWADVIVEGPVNNFLIISSDMPYDFPIQLRCTLPGTDWQIGQKLRLTISRKDEPPKNTPTEKPTAPQITDHCDETND
jgi:hypothetical protein